ncbi:MAG: O-antigen ligase family protein [Thermoanaerobaculum sp.]
MKLQKGFRELVVLASGLALVLVVPLVVDLGCSGPFRTPKALLAQSLWAVLAALFLARPSWDPFLAPPAAVAAAGLLSALATTPAAAYATVPWLSGVLGWAAVRSLPGEKRELLARAVVWAGFLEALVALAFFDPEGRPSSFRLLENLEGRYAWLGTMGNPADVGSFLVLPTVLALTWAWTGTRRVLWLALGLAQGAVLMATQTLSAMAAVLVGLAVLALARLPQKRRLPAVATLALAAAVLVLAAPPLRERLQTAWSQVQHGGWLWAASARGAAWTAALRMAVANPIFGVGFGQFEAHSFTFLRTEELAERGRILGMETGFGEAHNELFQYWAETGAVGLALLAFGLWLAWRQGRQQGTPKPAPRKGLPLPPGPLAAAAAVVAFFQFPLHLAAIAAQWAVLAAWLSPPLPAPRGSCRVGVAAGLALATLVVGGSFLQWRAYRAVQSAEVLVTLLRQNPQAPQRQTLAFEALRGLQRKLALLPWDYRAQTTAGNLAREAGDWPAAASHFRAALKLAERPETHFNLGVALYVLGQEPDALAHLVRAVALNPGVLRSVSDKVLASRLSAALEKAGYFARVPWARDWLPK